MNEKALIDDDHYEHTLRADHTDIIEPENIGSPTLLFMGIDSPVIGL